MQFFFVFSFEGSYPSTGVQSVFLTLLIWPYYVRGLKIAFQCVGCCFVLQHINSFRVIQCWIRFQTIQFSISIVFVYKQVNVKTVLFQTIQFSISIVFVYKQVNVKTVLFQTIQFSISIVFVYKQVNVKTVLFQTIQFSISTQFSSIWPIDRTLSGATTPGLSGPGSDGNKIVLCIPQSSSITETSPLDCLVSYAGHSMGESYPSAKKQSVYSNGPAYWTTFQWDDIPYNMASGATLCVYNV